MKSFFRSICALVTTGMLIPGVRAASQAPVIERIECRGNAATSCEFIRGHLYLTAGRRLDEEEIRNGKLRLSAVATFKSVDIYLEKGSEKGRVVVVIEVSEASPFTAAWQLGVSDRELNVYEPGAPGRLIETFAARLADSNLFGAGKVLDLLMVGDRYGATTSEYALRLGYLDPQLFGSQRYFLLTGVFDSHAEYDLPFVTQYPGVEPADNAAGADLSLGRRIGSFAYATIGYRYIFNAPSVIGTAGPFLVSDGTLTTLVPSPRQGLLITLGRSTEDDASFPTHGWMLHVYDVWDPEQNSHTYGGQIRATFQSSPNSFWTLEARPVSNLAQFTVPFDDELEFSASYAHTLGASTRSRWYLGPGFSAFGRDRYGFDHYEVGGKLGLRLETQTFGVVNLYIIGSTLTPRE
jgi:outer membrane protein assembly factor BamA